MPKRGFSSLLSSPRRPLDFVASEFGDKIGELLGGSQAPPRASGKSPDFPRSSPDFPGSSSPEVLSLWTLTAIQGFPGSFPDFPGSSPDFPWSFPDFPEVSPFLWEAWHPLLVMFFFPYNPHPTPPIPKPARPSHPRGLISVHFGSVREKNINTLSWLAKIFSSKWKGYVLTRLLHSDRHISLCESEWPRQPESQLPSRSRSSPWPSLTLIPMPSSLPRRFAM